MVSSTRFCLLFLTVLFANPVGGRDECKEAKCGPYGSPIRFPFRLRGRQPDHCGYPGFSVSCTDDEQTVLQLPADQVLVTLSVVSINYEDQEIRLYDLENCLARQILRLVNSSLTSPLHFKICTNITFFNCSSSPCPIYALNSFTDVAESDVISCTKMLDAPFVNTRYYPADYYFSLGSQISMIWSKPDCRNCEAKGKGCKLKNNGTEGKTECFDFPISSKGPSIKLIGLILGSILLMALIITVYHIYRSYKFEKDYEVRIEQFLEDYRDLKPTRYSYADIKKITDRFKEKLGQGAYGIVYKGKLSNEILVAVKMLNNSNGIGEEFINEVGTMGTIHHVNVVRLVGFCAEEFRRALVYEFLPNDSLEKFICSPEMKSSFLGWEKLQNIAVGISRGIEYLHQGCEQQILHFDIKPHNILLDQNFSPKISDFGLAKLCSKNQSAVSVTTARGTIGYIAPEVFSRNFGKVSFKSDVYSFGILLLEMVGGRKNVNTTAENNTEVYYPQWIYNLLEEGEDLRIHFEEVKDAEIAKKLAVVGLRCIQWHPVDRPSMKEVVQMLEGNGDGLSLPLNPFNSAAPTRMNDNNAQRVVNQSLEIIPELE